MTPSDPPDPEPEASSSANDQHINAYRAAERYYRHAAAAGSLPEALPSDPPTTGAGVLRTLHRTVPIIPLFLQLGWSALLVGISRWIPDKGRSPLTDAPIVELPNSVAFAAAFSLFILLSFVVAEATSRRRAAVNALLSIYHSLRHLTRKLRLLYPPGTWHRHPNGADLARLNAHLAAYPLALAHTLLSRSTHTREAAADAASFLPGSPDRAAALSPLLAAADVVRVANSHLDPHICIGVVLRGYFSSAEDDSPYNFSAVPADRTPSGLGTRAALVSVMDFIETNAAAADTIASFRLATPYVAVLRTSSFIWALLVPIALVREAGWWTLLWAFLGTMPVLALMRIAIMLSDPFQPSLLSVPLVQLSATATADILSDAAAQGLSLSRVLRPTDTRVPSWLTGQPISQVRGYAPIQELRDMRAAMSRAVRHATSPSLLMGMVAVMLWTGFIVFLTWGLSLDPPSQFRRPQDRWWRVSVPLPDAAVTFIAIALFLLLSFWLGDGNNRRAAALDIWMARVRPNLDATAHLVLHLMPPNSWHEGDRERLLAFIAALPVCMVQHLRGSRDLAALYALLSPDDVRGFENDRRPFPTHCADVIFAYLDAADSVEASYEAKALASESRRAFSATAFAFQARVLAADRALWESVAIQKTPIIPQFRAHLTVFATIWLLLLPVTIVRTDGFITFVYMAPIAFSMFTVIQISNALSDPFGCDDEDVPLLQVCDDIRDSIQRIYFAGQKGSRHVIRTNEPYKRETFEPRSKNAFDPSIVKVPTSNSFDGKRHPIFTRLRSVGPSIVRNYKKLFKMKRESPFRQEELPTLESRIYTPTLSGKLLEIIRRFPAISLKSYLAATLWSLAAVYISWGLGKLWNNTGRDDCSQWCSPVDVQGNVLSNIGFALFMILALRVTNAVSRFDSGGRIMFDLQREVRSLALEFLQVFKDGFIHDGDKERIIAHIVQIPLCLRDMLLNAGHGRNCAVEGLLSDGDKQRFVASASPFEHLIETLELYLFVQDSTIREGWDIDPFRPSPAHSLPMFARLLSLRQIASRASVTKRFPLATSLLKIETMFTLIYIFLLPLTMTAETGFFTILWAPVISYGVIAVRDVAAELVDPFGNDPGDLPIEKLTSDASNSVLEAVASAGWGSDQLMKSPPPETAQNALRALGARLRGRDVEAKFALPSVEYEQENNVSSTFDAIEQRRKKQTLFTHIAYSAPWRVMAISFVWAVAASASTAALRQGSLDNAWWGSTAIITADVLDGVSFGAFTLLSFFATASAARYQRAGTAWQRDLRRACHSLASKLTKYYKDGAIHDADHKRVLGLVAAIPLLLKQELREARDLRDVSALMTTADLAQAARKENMTLHCIDVLRAYLLRLSSRPEVLLVRDVAHPPTARTAFVRFQIIDIENAYMEIKFLNTFGFSPRFKTLLIILLAIWFTILPFLLYEDSGWLALFWTPIIAYGIMGLYAIANELSEPLGLDLNDHDIDEFSREIVEDVLDIQRTQEPAFVELKNPPRPPEGWARELKLADGEGDHPPIRSTIEPWWKRPLNTARYAVISVPLWQLVCLGLWGGVVLGLAFAVGGKFDTTCTGRWYCGLLAVNDDIKEYVGFALFFLLGARVTDSHARFTSALVIWKGTVTRVARLVASHTLLSYAPGSFDGNLNQVGSSSSSTAGSDGNGDDLARMMGHLAGVAIALGFSVRHGVHCDEDRRKVAEKLGEVVSESDAMKIAHARDPVGRCVDVVRAYLLCTERLDATKPERNGSSGEEYFVMLGLMDQLHEGATACQTIARVLQPFGLEMHARVLLAVWLFILPIGIVVRTGWLAVVWTVVVAFGVMAARRWAEELGQPFGCDEASIGVEALVKETVQAVRSQMRIFPRGAKTMLADGENRAGFEQFRDES